jgi:hypothetical protein
MDVGIPMVSLGKVLGTDFPLTVRLYETLVETIELLLLGDVQQELDNDRSGSDEELLKSPDVAIPLVSDGHLEPPVDRRDQHVLVVRTVEEDSLSLARALGMDSP